jgi:hypothetical protein
MEAVRLLEEEDDDGDDILALMMPYIPFCDYITTSMTWQTTQKSAVPAPLPKDGEFSLRLEDGRAQSIP